VLSDEDDAAASPPDAPAAWESPLPEPPPELLPDPSLEPLLSPDDAALAALVRVPLVEDRSFLAQPDPLKCTAGDVSAFVIVPSAPQAGQNRGPSALMPWITSIRCLQFEQM
jgi:hypothetical protein